jgi:hypothetical protein
MARRLLPREHGAYVQLLVPLVAALLAQVPTAAAVLFAIGGCLAFAANEPLLVALGHRGERMRETHGARARRLLGVLVPGAAASGIAALVLAPPPARLMAAVVAVPVALLLLLAWRRQERSLGGEVLAAAVLSGAAAPVSVAGGWSVVDAALLWAAWSSGYGCTVIAVHRVIDRNKREATRADHAVSAGLVAAAIGLAAVATIHSHAVIAVPLAAASAVIAIVAPPAARLRAIGFTLLGTSIASAVLAVALAT